MLVGFAATAVVIVMLCQWKCFFARMISFYCDKSFAMYKFYFDSGVSYVKCYIKTFLRKKSKRSIFRQLFVRAYIIKGKTLKGIVQTCYFL